MYKLLYLLVLMVVLLTGCTDVYNTNELNFSKVGSNYNLDTEGIEVYNNLETTLNSFSVTLNKDTKVAALTTSTANILDALGMNIVGVTYSDDLSDNLKAQLESGEIYNLGSVLEPSIETLLIADPDLVFASDGMPPRDQYQFIDNLIYLPQSYYEDIFYSVYCLTEEFGLSHDVFNSLVEIDQEAKSLADDRLDDRSVAVFTYAYDNLEMVSSNSFIGSMLSQIGITNMYGEYQDVDLATSYEKILLDNPDVIIIFGKGDNMQEYISTLVEDGLFDNLDAYPDNTYFIQSQSLSANIDSPKLLLQLSREIYE